MRLLHRARIVVPGPICPEVVNLYPLPVKIMHKKNWISLIIIMLLCLCLSGKENGSILFIAGDPSHGSGEHEYPQSCQLMAECLNQAGLGLQAEVSEGWPSGAALGKYSTIVIYSDGLDHHIANGHVPELITAIESGTGLVVLHCGLNGSCRDY